MTTLPERIQWILDRKAWSARELSRRAELRSETHVSLIVSGSVKTQVSAETLAKIARAANVELHWLVTGEGPRERGSDEIHPAIGRVADRIESASTEAQRRATTALLARAPGEVAISDDLATSLLVEAIANMHREETLAAALLSATAKSDDDPPPKRRVRAVAPPPKVGGEAAHTGKRVPTR